MKIPNWRIRKTIRNGIKMRGYDYRYINADGKPFDNSGVIIEDRPVHEILGIPQFDISASINNSKKIIIFADSGSLAVS